MAQHLAIARQGAEHDVAVELDLRDEERLLAAHQAEHDVEGVRARLAAVNLQPVGAPPVRPVARAELTDLAVYRATGSHALARLFGSVR